MVFFYLFYSLYLFFARFYCIILLVIPFAGKKYNTVLLNNVNLKILTSPVRPELIVLHKVQDARKLCRETSMGRGTCIFVKIYVGEWYNIFRNSKN